MLTCDGLRKSFGGLLALDDISAEFRRASITAIVGPNGAGKTTLLNVLTGFLLPDSGSWQLAGTDITSLRPDEIARRGVARTFQDLRVLTKVSVLENVMLSRPEQRGERILNALTGRGVKREERRHREEAMRALGLLSLRSKPGELAHSLSYGEQKLLSVACVLATEATVLVLDEPISGVHPAVAEEILGILTLAAREGRTVVFVEHDLAAVRRIADEVVVMDAGAIIGRGVASEVLARPEVLDAYVG